MLLFYPSKIEGLMLSSSLIGSDIFALLKKSLRIRVLLQSQNKYLHWSMIGKELLHILGRIQAKRDIDSQVWFVPYYKLLVGVSAGSAATKKILQLMPSFMFGNSISKY